MMAVCKNYKFTLKSPSTLNDGKFTIKWLYRHSGATLKEGVYIYRYIYHPL